MLPLDKAQQSTLRLRQTRKDSEKLSALQIAGKELPHFFAKNTCLAGFWQFRPEAHLVKYDYMNSSIAVYAHILNYLVIEYI